MRSRIALMAGAWWLLSAAAAATPACSVHAGARSATVVELYTSEGCNSCPPADRWLSTLKGRADVVAMAFHVDYWDRLGWPDRFADAAHSLRQYQLQRPSGARFVYTPQVVVNGEDWPWRTNALPAPRASPVEISLSRDGRRAQALVRVTGAPLRLSAYWVVLQDGLTSHVTAGENTGTTLRHDHVVRHYRTVASWLSGPQPASLTFEIPAELDSRARRVAFVVSNDATSLPLQAVQLTCP